MRTLALTVLVSALTLTGCAKPGTDRQNFRFGTFTNTSDGTTREEVMLDPTDTIETCTAIDIDGDAVGDGVAECPDADGDLLTPATSASPWGDAACHCLVDGYDLVGYIVEASTAELDADFDCLDTDASVGPTVTYYADVDTDTFGDALNHMDSCAVPSGYVLDATDCNDADSAINPAQVEIVSNGLDDDCDPATLDVPDADGDGYDISVDCNDGNSLVNPGAVDIDNDGLDNNCDGTTVDTICVNPKDSVSTVSWIVMLSNTTEFPYDSDHANWAAGLGTFTGSACISNLTITAGDGWKANGMFDANNDGTYGATDGIDYWLAMLTEDNLDLTSATAITVMGDTTSGLAKDIYGAGADYTFTVNTALPS